MDKDNLKGTVKVIITFGIVILGIIMFCIRVASSIWPPM